jgi:hypothetical protein
MKKYFITALLILTCGTVNAESLNSGDYAYSLKSVRAYDPVRIGFYDYTTPWVISGQAISISSLLATEVSLAYKIPDSVEAMIVGENYAQAGSYILQFEYAHTADEALVRLSVWNGRSFDSRIVQEGVSGSPTSDQQIAILNELIDADGATYTAFSDSVKATGQYTNWLTAREEELATVTSDSLAGAE